MICNCFKALPSVRTENIPHNFPSLSCLKPNAVQFLWNKKTFIPRFPFSNLEPNLMHFCVRETIWNINLKLGRKNKQNHKKLTVWLTDWLADSDMIMWEKYCYQLTWGKLAVKVYDGDCKWNWWEAQGSWSQWSSNYCHIIISPSYHSHIIIIASSYHHHFIIIIMIMIRLSNDLVVVTSHGQVGSLGQAGSIPDNDLYHNFHNGRFFVC